MFHGLAGMARGPARNLGGSSCASSCCQRLHRAGAPNHRFSCAGRGRSHRPCHVTSGSCGRLPEAGRKCAAAQARTVGCLSRAALWSVLWAVRGLLPAAGELAARRQSRACPLLGYSTVSGGRDSRENRPTQKGSNQEPTMQGLKPTTKIRTTGQARAPVGCRCLGVSRCFEPPPFRFVTRRWR